MQVGDFVRHLGIPELGVGEIIARKSDGFWVVRFEKQTCSQLITSSLILDCVKTFHAQKIRDNQLQKLKNYVSQLNLINIFENNYLQADQIFRKDIQESPFSKKEDIKALWNEYQRNKLLFVKKWVLLETGVQIDNEQAASVAAVNGHFQVIARAGSGKTTTMVSRVLFLLKNCEVAPNEILLLAFNRKAAEEISERVSQIIGCQVPNIMTFHALAYAIVHPEESLLYNGVVGESQGLSCVFQQLIDDHLQEPAFKEQIRELMLSHFREDWERIVNGCYDKNKEELLQFRRSLPRESLGGEYVKSYGEKVIADFLFEHDIDYKYERNHFWSGINYHPDFTIFQTPNSGVIIEYFGLKGDTDYDEMSEEKMSYWDSKQGWTLIDFYPSDIVAGGVNSFLSHLKVRLEGQGIPCIRLSEDEVWHRVRNRAIDRFTVATVGFIGRCRKQSLSPLELSSLIDSYSTISPVEEMFLRLALRLYVAYLDRQSATGEEDFDGLMQRATNAISAGQTLFLRKSGSGDLTSLRYVCIDEFQDFSDLFYRLLNAIRKQNPRIELFCVGDDWQAINGFAGSDLRFFENFAEHIGESRRRYISTNYRSSDSIVAVGNALMDGLGKPATVHKKTAGEVLVSDLNEFKPSSFEQQRHPGDFITPAILRLCIKSLADGLDVVMLCRRNAIPWFVNYQDHVGGFGRRGLDRYLGLVRSFFPRGLKERITISTAHKYKGLENPMVIVLDAIARSYPLIHPDWAFSRILGDSPEKIIREERRLLYVTLTRAVEKLVIITDGRSKSPFLEELERKQPPSAINWADYPPDCGATTRLLVKVGNQDRRGGAPTISIKDLLKASKYHWQSTGWNGWTKSFPAEGFSIDTIKAEVWAGAADGIDVRIYDGSDALIGRYLINKGQWFCDIDNLAQKQL